MKWSDLVSPSRVDEMTRPTLGDAMQKLASAGYRKTGAGSYGAVFQKPGRDAVLKLFTPRDKPMIEYYKIVGQNQSNPYFPKLRGPVIRINQDYMAVQIEQLTPTTPSDTAFIDSVDNALAMGITRTAPSDPQAAAWIKHLLSDANAKVALNLIINMMIQNGWKPDIKSSNIMKRSDGHYVITDPVYVGSDAFMNSPEVAPDGRFKTYNTESEQLDEVTRPTLKQAEEKLIQAGWRMIGDGHFGRTYEHPKRDDILKLYASSDVGYTQFLNYIREFPSQYFPKIIGGLIRVTPQYNAVRLERLDTYSLDFPFDAGRVLRGLRYQNMKKYADSAMIYDFEQKYPRFLQTMQRLIEFGLRNGYRIDFESGHNIMFRDGTPVVIDPFATKTASLEGPSSDEFEIAISKGRKKKGPVAKLPAVNKRDPQKMLPMSMPRMNVPADQRSVIGEAKEGLYDMAKSYTDLAGRLREHNYRKVEDTDFSRIWRKNNSVLVVMDIRDEASREYVEYCKSSINQHVPVVLDGPKKVTPHHRMYTTRAFDRMTDQLWNRIKAFEQFVDYKKNPGSYPDVEDARKAYPNVYTLLDRLHQKGMFRKYNFDLDRSVWREYNGRPILVNPFVTKTVHTFRESLNEKFDPRWNLGGGWITPEGQFVEIDHDNNVHHTDIAVRAFNDIPDEDMQDFHSHADPVNPKIIYHALTKGWIRVSTDGQREFNVEYEPNKITRKANDALARYILKSPDFEEYRFFNSYDDHGVILPAKRLASLHVRREVA